MCAEVGAVDIGLKITWDLGYRKVHLDMHSKPAVSAICSEIDEDVCSPLPDDFKHSRAFGQRLGASKFFMCLEKETRWST
ncbi:hypothetical protein LINPERHAP2_LOCUS1832 [Linum perenne]